MSSRDGSTVLIPVDVSETEIPPVEILDLLGAVDVVLLGYYPVPSQAAPAQIKHQHGSDAVERLEAVKEALVPCASTVHEELYYTHDRQETIDRVADEYGCDAVLRLGPADDVSRILVPLRGDSNIDSILGLVGDLLRAGDASVTLFHSAEEDGDPQYGETLLADAAERLHADGIDPDRIDRQLSATAETGNDIVERARNYDVVVLGETEPSLRERILGVVPRRTITGTDRPVFVVRNTDA
jgi:nucleotide-binding universal stress UspA family protein